MSASALMSIGENSKEISLASRSFYSGERNKYSGKIRHYLTPLERKAIRDVKFVNAPKEDETPIKEKMDFTLFDTEFGKDQFATDTNRKLDLKFPNRKISLGLNNNKNHLRSTPKKTTGTNPADIPSSKTRSYSWAPISLGKSFRKASKNFQAKCFPSPVLERVKSTPLDNRNQSLPINLSSVIENRMDGGGISPNVVTKSASLSTSVNVCDVDSPPSKMRKLDEDVAMESCEKENLVSHLAKDLSIQYEVEQSEKKLKTTPSKFFPIFSSVKTRSATSQLKDLTRHAINPDSPMTPKNLAVTLHGTSKVKSINKTHTQMVIDAGQRHFGAIQCSLCGMVYSANHPTDEKEHSVYHKRFLSLMRFPGWKNEHVVGSFMDGRIIKIFPNDPKYATKKVSEVLSIVDTDLGFKAGHSELTSLKCCFLFISEEEKIVGCLIAEKIYEAYRMIPTTNSNLSCSGNALSTTESSSVPAVCGISRIWTYGPMRRCKIASRLVDTLRCSFVLGTDLQANQVAFSDPTPDGRAFATRYFKTERILVYNFLR